MNAGSVVLFKRIITLHNRVTNTHPVGFSFSDVLRICGVLKHEIRIVWVLKRSVI